MRLIDADALIPNEVHTIIRLTATGEQTESVVYAEQIDKAPTVDAVERMRGRWIPVDSYSAFGGDEEAWEVQGNPIAFYYCSECKEQTYAGENGESLTTDFCPFCGADMRGENNG